MARKTFSVEEFKNHANEFCKNSRDDQAGCREGMAIAIQNVLHSTGNYRGFGYLNRENMADSLYGKTVGINTSNTRPAESMTNEERFEGTDKTRVEYF